MTTLPLRITAGVDTHLDVHVAAALDDTGGLLGVESFATTTAGYRRLLAWLRGFGELELVGIEGTGSYGAGLTRVLLGESVRVVEIDRPNRQRRRRRGKSDPQDAITAARAAQSGDACGEAKTQGRKRRGHAGSSGRPLLGAQGAHPDTQPDAQPDLDRPGVDP